MIATKVTIKMLSIVICLRVSIHQQPKIRAQWRLAKMLSDLRHFNGFPILFPTKGETGRTLSPAYPYAKARFLAEVAQRQPNPAFLHECPVQEIMMSRFGIYRANFPPIDLKLFELGRASCRERVCQYV